MQLRDAITGAWKHTLEGHSHWVNAVTFSVMRKNQGAWDLEVKHPLHNHGPSLNAAAHQAKGRWKDIVFYPRTETTRNVYHGNAIRNLTKVGLNPKHIHAANTITQQDVYISFRHLPRGGQRRSSLSRGL